MSSKYKLTQEALDKITGSLDSTCDWLIKDSELQYWIEKIVNEGRAAQAAVTGEETTIAEVRESILANETELRRLVVRAKELGYDPSYADGTKCLGDPECQHFSLTPYDGHGDTSRLVCLDCGKIGNPGGLVDNPGKGDVLLLEWAGVPENSDAATDPEPVTDDSVKHCPDCETPTQFGEVCPECTGNRNREYLEANPQDTPEDTPEIQGDHLDTWKGERDI